MGKLREGTLSKKQEKLLNRYEAISAVQAQIQAKSHFSTVDIQAIKDAVVLCQNNQPEKAERSYLQVLADFFTVGLTAKYRSFFSKERQLAQEAQENLPTNFKT